MDREYVLGLGEVLAVLSTVGLVADQRLPDRRGLLGGVDGFLRAADDPPDLGKALAGRRDFGAERGMVAADDDDIPVVVQRGPQQIALHASPVGTDQGAVAAEAREGLDGRMST